MYFIWGLSAKASCFRERISLQLQHMRFGGSWWAYMLKQKQKWKQNTSLNTHWNIYRWKDRFSGKQVKYSGNQISHNLIIAEVQRWCVGFHQTLQTSLCIFQCFPIINSLKRSTGVPVVVQQKRIQLGTMRLRVRSLASLSGLGVQHCHELWHRLQMWLGSGVAMAVV